MPVSERPVWSRTQVSALQECRRKFFFHTQGTEASAPYKKMKNRHLWSGSAVHEAIGEILKTLRQGSPAPDLETFIAGVKEKMRIDFKTSVEGSGARLFEHEYGISLPQDVWRGHWATVEKSLRWFYASRWMTRLSTLGPECWKAVDEVLEFDVNGIKAYVKIDCAIETDGKFYLIDWKTSAPDVRVEPSLLTAALYAHEVWGAEIENTTAMAVSLVDGKTFHANVNEETLMEAHLRIEEEAASLQEAASDMGTDPFQIEAAGPETCRRCSFQKLCFPAGL